MAQNLAYDSWCKRCHMKKMVQNQEHKYTLNHFNELAKKKDGVCLSDTYDWNSLKFKCKEGHEWTCKGQSIIKGHWCKKCGRKIASIKSMGPRKYSIEFFKLLAEKNKGKCLSNEYFNYNAILEFSCKKNHTWKATAASIIRGSWCKLCLEHKMENKVRSIFKELLCKDFTNCRPDFLKNKKTGRNLELDGYNSDLKLAFEYNGVQHYKLKFPQGKHSNLEYVQTNDNLKKELCEKNGIKLIVVPYTVKDLKIFISEELHKHGIDV
jgi:hypothetical protein